MSTYRLSMRILFVETPEQNGRMMNYRLRPVDGTAVRHHSSTADRKIF
jgi:hypothetical protein